MNSTLEDEIMARLVAQLEQVALNCTNQVDTRATELTDNMFVVWGLLNVFNVLSMQIGFCNLECGVLAEKHRRSILLKNVLDFVVGALVWYSFGYRLYATAGGNFFENDVQHFQAFMTMYGFAATTITIVSGAGAGRLKVNVYLWLVVFLCGILFPLIAGNVWEEGGLLNNYIDFAGGMVVHGMGGIVALVVAIVCGPRAGRVTTAPDSVTFQGVKTFRGIKDMPSSSSALQALGAFMLAIAWFSFNCVSSGGADSVSLAISLRAGVNTLLGCSTSTLTGLAFAYLKTRHYNLDIALNSMLAGLVGITANCAFIDTWAACVVGIVSAILFILSGDVILYRYHIDDVLQASAVHGSCGIWSGLAVGLFHQDLGLFTTGQSEQFLIQLYGTAIIGLVTLAFSTIVIGLLWLAHGKRIAHSEGEQIIGLDFVAHAGLLNDDCTDDDEYTKRNLALREFQKKPSAPSSPKNGTAAIAPAPEPSILSDNLNNNPARRISTGDLVFERKPTTDNFNSLEIPPDHDD